MDAAITACDVQAQQLQRSLTLQAEKWEWAAVVSNTVLWSSSVRNTNASSYAKTWTQPTDATNVNWTLWLEIAVA